MLLMKPKAYIYSEWRWWCRCEIRGTDSTCGVWVCVCVWSTNNTQNSANSKCIFRISFASKHIESSVLIWWWWWWLLFVFYIIICRLQNWWSVFVWCFSSLSVLFLSLFCLATFCNNKNIQIQKIACLYTFWPCVLWTSSQMSGSENTKVDHPCHDYRRGDVIITYPATYTSNSDNHMINVCSD